ncbi:hydrolase, alpha/beta domain protein, partial [Cooperia oncophora]
FSTNLHRAGRTRDAKPLTWDKFFDENRQVDVDGDSFNVYLKGNTGPVFYFLHGGGYSGLTWACLAAELSSRIQCRLLVPDLRGHGKTHTKDEKDLSVERQTRDIIAIYNAVFGAECQEDPPLVCVVGHSMGGALAVHVVATDEIPNVVGLVVIDVVEGSAMDALAGMRTFLRGRPSSFESEEKAITWCLQSGATRNREAAKISMPSQIKKTEDGKYVWRIDLMDTEPYWVGWFQGLSAKFLSCGPPKLLVLAGVDRLDKDLTIAQMQGKFQNTILPKVGHAVQEDSPDLISLTKLGLRFLMSNNRYSLKLRTRRSHGPWHAAHPIATSAVWNDI